MSQHLKAACSDEYTASLKCIETKGRSECEELFERYKECKQNEIDTRRARRIAARQEAARRPSSVDKNT
jgi:hypothetical protein